MSALLFCLLAAQAAVATAPAPVQVTGQVLVKGSRDTVGAAAVLVDGQPAAITDEQGRFTLSLVPGDHTIHLDEAGFEPLDQTITAPGAAVVLRLVPRGDRPRYETVVAGDKGAPPSVQLRDEEMTTIPGTLGDPFRVIESLPGVTPVLWPLPIYAVRGANPGNTGYFIDGLRVPALFHFALGPAVVHPYFLEGLDFYPGAAPASFGRSVSGVVAASTAAPPADRVRGSVDLRVFDAGGMLSVPFDRARGTVTVAGRYGYPGPLLGLLQDRVSLEYWDYQARIEHTLGPGRLTLALLGSNDVLEQREEGYGPDGPTSRKERLALSFHRADLRWQGGVGRGRLLAAVGVGLDRTTTPYTNMGEAGAHARSLNPRVRYQRPLGGAVDFSVGADGELADYGTTLAGVSQELAADFTRPRKTALVGAWTALELRLGEHLAMTPAVRVDRYQEGGARAVDVQPRLSLSLRASDRITIKAAGGKASQLPSLPLQLPGFDGFGLAQHGLQTSWQGSLGVAAALPWALNLEVTGFENRFVLTDVRDPDLGDPLLADFLTRRQALSYGVELMLRRPATERFHGWLAYTLSRGLRAFEGGVVGPADWDQRHVLNLVTGYRWRRWTFGARFHLHTGRMVKIEDSNPVDFDRLPPFYQLDLRVDRRFLLDRFAIDVFVELVNTTLTREVVALRQGLTGYREDGFSIALPSVGMRAEF